MANDPGNKKKSVIYRGKLWEDKKRTPPPKKVQKDLDQASTCDCVQEEYSACLKKKYEAGIELLKEAELLNNTHIVPPLPAPRQLEYRTHAKLAVRGMKDCANPNEEHRFAMGLFKPQSHLVMDHPECSLHKGSINRLVHDLRLLLNASDLQPYAEDTHDGDLRYVAIRASHLTEEVMLTFVMTTDKHRHLIRNMVNTLREKGHQINSAHINVNADETNTIFGSESRRIAGTDRLRERLCDLDFEIGPTSFFQVNPWQAEVIYRRIHQLAGQRAFNDVAWDLYCGTGQISLLLAQSGYRVLGIEANPQAIRDAQNNAVRNRIDNPPHYITGKVEDLHTQLPSWAQQPKLIVVNPARKGLAEPVRQFIRGQLKANPSTRLIYMSCEVQTLTRDLKEIAGNDLPLRQIEAFDMFPYTEKMEWLAIVN